MESTHARVVANLKRFNAKERDHLMRFAYLGATRPYDTPGPWLSPACMEALEQLARPRLSNEARCVFAGMDYHLDWLYAALTLAQDAPGWDGVSESSPSAREGATGRRPAAIGCSPVQGSPEDLDLLVAFQGGGELLLLLVEAKPTGRFDRKQMGRKLLRLDAILQDAPKHNVRALFVLAAPEPPQLGRDTATGRDRDCRQFAAQARGTSARDLALKEALVQSPTGVGCEWAYLPLPNFPSATASVMRVDGDNRECATGSNWKAIPRRRSGSTKDPVRASEG